MPKVKFMRLNDALVKPVQNIFINAAVAAVRPVVAAEITSKTGGAVRPEMLEATMVSTFNPVLLNAGLQPFVLQATPSVTEAEAPSPIAPKVDVTDLDICRDGKDAAKIFYLPRYRLRTLPNNAGRYEVATAAESDGLWSMRFGLETFPAAEIASQVRTAAPLSHKLSIKLKYTVANTSIQKTFPTFAVATDARGLVVEMRLSLDERDAVLRAFRSDDGHACLTITRVFDICIPAPPDASTTGQQAPQPLVLNSNMTVMRAARVTEFTATADLQTARVVNTDVSPQLRGINRRAFPGNIGATPPLIVAEPPVGQPQTPAVPKFTPTSRALDCLVALRFDSDVHPYIFPSGMGTSSGSAEMFRVTLRHPADDSNGRLHSYFCNVTRPNRFYYLPDAFKLARTATAPFVPAMRISVDQNQGQETVVVNLTAMLRPDIDAARLQAAKIALKAHLPVSAGNKKTDVELEPLPATSVLKLGLPRAGLIQTIETDASVDLANGFLIEEQFAFTDFQDVFAALNTTGVSTLFRGVVVVTTGLAAPELIPVEIRFADMEGEVFTYDEQTDQGAGTVSAILRNATESPLKIDSLPVWLRRDKIEAKGRIDGAGATFPAVLAPDASFSISIHAEQPLSGSGPIDAIFDLAQVHAQPNPENILKLILDTSVPQECIRPVTVMTAADLLGDSDPPDVSIRVIVIEFRGNKRALLNKDKLEVNVDVPVPLVDVLLRRDSEGTYSYRQTVVYKSNRQVVDAAWRQSDLGVLFVPAGAA